MVKRSRRFSHILQEIDKSLLYSPHEALLLLKKFSSVKFNETLEAHIVLGLDPKYADQQLRSTVILPKGSGKLVRVAVITQPSKVNIATSAPAEVAIFTLEG